jgi:hypothetical protein
MLLACLAALLSGLALGAQGFDPGRKIFEERCAR